MQHFATFCNTFTLALSNNCDGSRPERTQQSHMPKTLPPRLGLWRDSPNDRVGSVTKMTRNKETQKPKPNVKVSRINCQTSWPPL